MDKKKPSTLLVVMPMFMTFISLVLSMDYGRLLLNGDTSARRIFAFIVWTAMIFVWGRIALARLKAKREAGES